LTNRGGFGITLNNAASLNAYLFWLSFEVLDVGLSFDAGFSQLIKIPDDLINGLSSVGEWVERFTDGLGRSMATAAATLLSWTRTINTMLSTYVVPVLNVVNTARNVIDNFDEVISHALHIQQWDKLLSSFITQSKPFTTFIITTSSLLDDVTTIGQGGESMLLSASSRLTLVDNSMSEVLSFTSNTSALLTDCENALKSVSATSALVSLASSMMAVQSVLSKVPYYATSIVGVGKSSLSALQALPLPVLNVTLSNPVYAINTTTITNDAEYLFTILPASLHDDLAAMITRTSMAMASLISKIQDESRLFATAANDATTSIIYEYREFHNRMNSVVESDIRPIISFRLTSLLINMTLPSLTMNASLTIPCWNTRHIESFTAALQSSLAIRATLVSPAEALVATLPVFTRAASAFIVHTNGLLTSRLAVSSYTTQLAQEKVALRSAFGHVRSLVSNNIATMVFLYPAPI
jgi:hypothetical protein